MGCCNGCGSPCCAWWWCCGSRIRSWLNRRDCCCCCWCCCDWCNFLRWLQALLNRRQIHPKVRQIRLNRKPQHLDPFHQQRESQWPERTTKREPVLFRRPQFGQKLGVLKKLET